MAFSTDRAPLSASFMERLPLSATLLVVILDMIEFATFCRPNNAQVGGRKLSANHGHHHKHINPDRSIHTQQSEEHQCRTHPKRLRHSWFSDSHGIPCSQPPWERCVSCHRRLLARPTDSSKSPKTRRQFSNRRAFLRVQKRLVTFFVELNRLHKTHSRPRACTTVTVHS